MFHFFKKTAASVANAGSGKIRAFFDENGIWTAKDENGNTVDVRGVGYSGLTSTTNVTATGSKVFTVNKSPIQTAFASGQRVRGSNSNGSIYFEGVITTFTSTTDFTVLIDIISGAVSDVTSWTFSGASNKGDAGNAGQGFSALTSTTSITPVFNSAQVLTVSAAVGAVGNAFAVDQWVYVYNSTDNWFIGQITAYTTTSMTVLPRTLGKSVASAASWTITLAARADTVAGSQLLSTDGIHPKIQAETLTQAQEATLQASQANGARGLILLNHVRGGSTADGSGTAKGRMLPAFASNQGVCSLQPHVSDVSTSVFTVNGPGLTTNTQQGDIWAVGTGTAVAFADTVYGRFDKMLTATAATAGNAIAIRGTAKFTRGTGFHFIAHCNPFGSGANANTRWFAGLDNAVFTNVALTSGNPTQSRVGFCFDPAQTTMRVISSVAGTGTLSVVDLGASFPTNNAAVWYKMELFLEPSGTEIFYRIEKYDTSNLLPSSISEGSFTTTANFPAAATALAANVTIMTTAAAAVGQHIGKIVVEKQF